MSEVADVRAGGGCRRVDNLIGGRWTPSADRRTFERCNPARPGEVVGEYPDSGPHDVDLAVAAAKGAFTVWSQAPFAERAAVLSRAAALLEDRADRLASAMTREMGKPVRESRMEVLRAAAIFRYFAGEALRPVGEMFAQSVNGNPVYTLHRPLGVVGLITPWNFPAAIPAWKLAPALVYGNTVVMKPARDAPGCALALAAALDDAGLPTGVLNVVVGGGASVGTPIVQHPDVSAISFTGSATVGHRVRDDATSRGKKVQLELGGQNPLIVMADADLERAAEAAYAGAFWSAGQKCTATRRIYVEAGAYDRFRALLLARVGRGVVGDPADPQTEVGPLVHEGAMGDVLRAIEQARDEGGTLIAGGERVGEGYTIAPTVFEEVDDGGLLACEEVFGPVTSLYRFEALDEAIARANAVDYGLSASIFTSRLDTSQRFVRELQAGILHVNSQTAGADIHVPFGGVKGSGHGPHEQGRAARDFYTDLVTVYQDA